MQTKLTGKTALVTGAGKKTGIGYGIAKKLASMGANIIIADLGMPSVEKNDIPTGSKEEMETIAEELKKTYHVKTWTFNVDVTDNQSIDKMVTFLKIVENRAF